MKCPNCSETHHASDAVFCHMCGHKMKTKSKWTLIGVVVLAIIVVIAISLYIVLINADYTELTVNGVTVKMIKVDGGVFFMGATNEHGSEAKDWEKPVHQVNLNSFYIGETEVTQALWEAVMGQNPSSFRGDNLPVDNVSWDDCVQFCQLLSQKTGKRFRLPTEAEWEFAARGGNQSNHYKYAGSDNLYDVAWCINNSDNIPHVVKTKKPNELGIYDMTGNVWEWCGDWYARYDGCFQDNPMGPSSGKFRVHRGGGWLNSPLYCRVSYRYYAKQGRRNNFRGFRLAMDP